MKYQLKQKGFTLIELVVVIIIIGILAASGMTIYGDATTNAEEAARDSFGSNVKSALAIYLATNKTQPTNTQLATMVQGGTAATNGVTASINSTTYTAPTYTDSCGGTATTSATVGTVVCVGDPTSS